MNSQEIIAEIRAHDLPAKEFVVVGGGALAIRQIRDTDDIDLVVTQSLFENLKKAGWNLKVRPNGKPGLHRANLEAYLDVNCGDFQPSTSWLLEHSETIEGVQIIDLETLTLFKRNYGREKDLRDLALISQHLSASDGSEESAT